MGSAKRLFGDEQDDPVATVSLIVAIDKVQLIERVGKVTARKLERCLAASILSKAAGSLEGTHPQPLPFREGRKRKPCVS